VVFAICRHSLSPVVMELKPIMETNTALLDHPVNVIHGELAELSVNYSLYFATLGGYILLIH
jgi:hypothetical protein